MNKIDLAARVSNETGLSIRDAQRVLGAAFEGIVSALEQGDDVYLHGFGTFQIRARCARTVVHPSTREPILLPEGRNIAFSPASQVRRRVAAKR